MSENRFKVFHENNENYKEREKERMKQKRLEMTVSQKQKERERKRKRLNTADTSFEFFTPQSFGKALAKVKKSLPLDPERRKRVLKDLCLENDIKIIEPHQQEPNVSNNKNCGWRVS